MYCPNCGTEIPQSKFCPECGTPLNQSSEYNQADNTPATIQPKPGNSKKKKKSKTGCLVAFIIAVIITACVLIIGIIINNINAETADNDNTTVSTSENKTTEAETTTEKNSTTKKTTKKKKDYQVIFEDDYFRARYIKVYSENGIDGVVYLKLRIENKSKQTIIVSLNNTALNQMSVTSGTAVPISILPGNASEQPFMLFTQNSDVTTADDVINVQFSFDIFDENYNTIENCKVIGFNIK